jgi:4-hydroxy-2-oxoheptanedioate aldolase
MYERIETMKMRPSRVLAKLRAGGVASCMKLNLADPRAAEIAAMSGFDCIWLCMEHVPSTIRDIENQVRAAKVFDVDTVVRVARGSYSDLILPLEVDAAGIMVPHVMSAEDVREIVWRTRFHPVGRRPIDGGNADGAYCTIPGPEYMRQANEQRFVIVQIEDPEPLDELDRIAEVEGIDMLFFGPGDFSHGIGAPCQFDDPRIEETCRRVAKVARKHGKFAGTITDLESLQEKIDMGYQFLNVGADVVTLTHDFARIATAFGQRTAAPAESFLAASDKSDRKDH